MAKRGPEYDKPGRYVILKRVKLTDGTGPSDAELDAFVDMFIPLAEEALAKEKEREAEQNSTDKRQSS